MSIVETTASVQDQVLGVLASGEDGVISAVRSLVEAIEPLTSLVPEAPFADQLPSPTEVIDLWFGFGEKLLANQKRFALELAQLVSPAPAKPATVKASARKAA